VSIKVVNLSEQYQKVRSKETRMKRTKTNLILLTLSLVLLTVGALGIVNQDREAEGNMVWLYGSNDSMVWLYGSNDSNDITEHSIIYDSQIYVPTSDLTTKDGGITVISLSGEAEGIYGNTIMSYAAPVVWEHLGETYIYVYDLANGYLNMIRKSDNTIVNTAKLSASNGALTVDIEGLGWDWVHNGIIVPSYENTTTKYFTCYDMTDLSVAWHWPSSWVSGNNGVPLVLEGYAYIKPNDDANIYKLNVITGAVVSSLNLGGASMLSYASPMYDPGSQHLYSLGADATVHAINPSDMSPVWSHEFTPRDTGMTSPLIHNTTGCHNGLVFCPVRDEGAGGTQYHAKLYALNALDGSVVWVTTTAWDLGYDYTSMLLTDEEIVIPCHDVLIPRADDTKGELHVFSQADGTLLLRRALPLQPMCGGVTQAINGSVIINMSRGYVGSYKLGRGTVRDSVHYNKNCYHNNYVGDLLELVEP